MRIKQWNAYIEDGNDYDLVVAHEESPFGTWVRYDDHVAEVERLRAREAELAAALGDVMASIERHGSPGSEDLRLARAALEGADA